MGDGNNIYDGGNEQSDAEAWADLNEACMSDEEVKAEIEAIYAGEEIGRS